MSSKNFAYWLQGYLELAEGEKGLTAKQVKIIEEHLALVLHKVTPEAKKPVGPSAPPWNKRSGKLC